MKPAILFFLLLSLATAAVGSTLTFTYDQADRLVQINYGANTNTTLTYDNNGNLLARSTFIGSGADFAVAQTVTPAPGVVGVPLTYTVVAYNNSSIAGSGVAVTNLIPANASLLSTSTSQGSLGYNGGVLTWNVGSLNAGASATLTFDLSPYSTGQLTNLVTIASAQPDPVLPNNANSLITSVVEPPALAAQFSGPNILLSWPIFSGRSFSVEFTTDLASPILWTPIPSTPYVYAEQFYLLDNTTNSTRFYRLTSEK